MAPKLGGKAEQGEPGVLQGERQSQGCAGCQSPEEEWKNISVGALLYILYK